MPTHSVRDGLNREAPGSASNSGAAAARGRDRSIHRALSQTILYFVTIAVSQGLSFLLLPVVTHYLSPQEYGDYALALSVSSLIDTFASSWVRNLSFRLFYQARAMERTRAFFLSIAVLQAVLVLVLYVPTALILGVGTHYIALPVMLAAGLAVLAGDFYAHSVSLLRAEQQAIHYSVSEISSAVIRVGIILAGLAMGIRSSSILFLASALAAGLIGLGAATVLQRKLTGPARLDGRVMREIVRYGPASLPFSVATWGERLMDRLILDHFVTREIVGVYAANYVLADRIIGGLMAAIFLMAWPEILRSWTDHGKPAAQEAITRGLTLYLWFTTGPALFIAVFHKDVGRLLGPAYREGSEIMPFIVAATWMHGFAGYLNRHLELNLRFATLSSVVVGGAVVNLLMNLILIPRLGIQGAALATLCNVTATGLVFWFMRDRELVRLPYDAMLEVALVLVSAFLLSRVPVGSYPRLATFVIVYGGGAAYFVLRQWQARNVMAC